MLLFLQEKWDSTKTMAPINIISWPFSCQKLVQLCCATCLDQFLTYVWTIVCRFWLFWFLPKPLFIVVFFSTILHVLSPHQKIGNTFCEHNCANWKNTLGCDLHFWFMGCLQCYLTNVLMGVKNNKNSKITNKQEPDNKILARNHPILCFQKETDNTYVNHSNFTSKRNKQPNKTTKNKNITQTKNLLTNITQKHSNCKENKFFLIISKQDKRHNQNNKTNPQNKQIT